MEHSIPFVKMHGSGNHFVLIDNRDVAVPREDMADWARAVCRPGFGVGADGLIFLEPAPVGIEADYVWHFYNADGSRAEMCGNGSRCASQWAASLGLAGPEHVLGTDAGPIKAKVLNNNEVKVQLTPPFDLRLHQDLEVRGRVLTAHSVNTGVPHAVVLSEAVENEDVAHLGETLRYHPAYAPAGTNVNFIQILDRTHMLLRTYERGVEAETYACGTGAAASAIIANALGLVEPQVKVTTTGGEHLQISLENDSVFLQGKAILVYTGLLRPESVGLSAPGR